MSKDFNVTVKIRNNRILKRMRELGILSLAELARQSGAHPTHTCAMVGFKMSPLRRTGEWNTSAMNISSALRCEPEDLWPEYMRRAQLLKNTFSLEASAEELVTWTKISTEVGGMEVTHNDVLKMLQELLPRQERALRLRYGFDCKPATLDEISQELNVCRERARQILNRSERLLKSKLRAKKAKADLTDPDEIKKRLKDAQLRALPSWKKPKVHPVLDQSGWASKPPPGMSAGSPVITVPKDWIPPSWMRF